MRDHDDTMKSSNDNSNDKRKMTGSDGSSSRPSVRWCAFYGDCEHEILPVTKGHRVTVTYNLYIKETISCLDISTESIVGSNDRMSQSDEKNEENSNSNTSTKKGKNKSKSKSKSKNKNSKNRRKMRD